MNTNSVMKNDLIKINLLLFSLDTRTCLYFNLNWRQVSNKNKVLITKLIFLNKKFQILILLCLLHQTTRTGDYVNFTWLKISKEAVFLINKNGNTNEELLIFNLLLFFASEG